MDEVEEEIYSQDSAQSRDASVVQVSDAGGAGGRSSASSIGSGTSRLLQNRTMLSESGLLPSNEAREAPASMGLNATSLSVEAEQLPEADDLQVCTNVAFRLVQSLVCCFWLVRGHIVHGHLCYSGSSNILSPALRSNVFAWIILCPGFSGS